MSNHKTSARTGPQKLVSLLLIVARFSVPIQIFAFLFLASILGKWLSAPVSHALSAFLVSLPSYWLIPKRKVNYAVYVVFCAVFAAALALAEYLLLG